MTNKEAKEFIIHLMDNFVATEDELQACKMAIKALEQEQLTDTEQRIFLAAMRREEKVCKEVDERYPDREPHEDSLVSVCHRIERKVKKALWGLQEKK